MGWRVPEPPAIHPAAAQRKIDADHREDREYIATHIDIGEIRPQDEDAVMGGPPPQSMSNLMRLQRHIEAQARIRVMFADALLATLEKSQ